MVPTADNTARSGRSANLAFVQALLDHGRMVILMPLAVAAAVAAVTLALPRVYTSTVAFVPIAGSAQGRLTGVAAQLGLPIPGADASESPDFYADLLEAPHSLRQLVWLRFTSPGRGDTATRLIDLLDVSGPDSARREERAVRKLTTMIRATVTTKTGVVTFAVTSRRPDLSAQLADSALQLVHRFNLQRRQTRAMAERRFVEGRLGSATAESRAADRDLETWLARNRNFNDSPRLRFEYQRLLRDVELKQAVVATLTQAFEQARIDEVRDTPVIAVVGEAVVPARADSRRLIAKVILGYLAGFGLAVIVAGYRSTVRRLEQERPDELAELRAGLRKLRPGR